MIEETFTSFSAGKLDQLSSRIQDCLRKLSYQQVWARSSDNENSIGNLVLHLCGNVRQWIGSGIGGQPDTRARDTEFSARGDIQPDELARRLASTVSGAIEIIRRLTPQRLAEETTIQNYTITVLEAVYHVVEHFAQHTGQILFATKLLTGQDLGYYKHLNKSAHAEKTP